MKRLWSWTGALFGLAYAAPIGYAYIEYLRHAGTGLAGFLASSELAIVVLPFTLTMRWLNGGDFDFTADMTGRVAAAAVFCCGLAYILGGIIEAIVRTLLRATVGR
jgi:hypothetical protein